MSLVSGYYTSDKGWVLVKNRDRRYKPFTRIRKSLRNGIERLYSWDEQSRYTEGINEFGVSIISSIFTSEIEKLPSNLDLDKKSRYLKSPEGLRIRTALFEKTAYSAVKKLTDLEIPGNTIVADAEECYILEGAYFNDQYISKVKRIPNTSFVVRTNYPVFVSYSPQEASVIRRNFLLEKLRRTLSFDELIDVCSISDEMVDTQANPVRLPLYKKDVRTTGQIVLVPLEKTMYYRSIWESIYYDVGKLNTLDGLTYFELLSSRKFYTQVKEGK